MRPSSLLSSALWGRWRGSARHRLCIIGSWWASTWMGSAMGTTLHSWRASAALARGDIFITLTPPMVPPS
eukprot:6139549-Prymnesium_polylepis.1